MQLWEYLFLVANWDNGWKIEMINGQKIPGWEEGPSMYDYINALGEQGWEMVSYQYFSTFDSAGQPPSDEYESYRIVLKRPKDQ